MRILLAVSPRRRLAVLCLVVALAGPVFARALSSDDVARVLRPLLKRHAMPAMGGAVVTSRGLQGAGVVGVRRADADLPVEVSDAWHLGSDTKAMTATMLATLVEEGRLRWDSTVGEVLGEAVPGLSREAAAITLLQLLQHRSGLPANLRWDDISERLPVREQRLEAVRTAFEHGLPGQRGAFLYSNLGYVVAAAMAEQRTGQSWETLMERRVFGPLGMRSVGYGPITGGEGPRAHDAEGRPVDFDNPPVISPAGRVHCSLADWSRFVADQLRGARGAPALLKPQSYRVLQTPAPGGEQACGWMVVRRAWGGRVLTHAGTNTLNYSVVWMSPENDFAVLTTANRGGDAAFEACDEAAWGLIQVWLGPSSFLPGLPATVQR